MNVSDSSTVHQQEFFTVHIAMVYVIQVYWQLVSRRKCSCSQAARCSKFSNLFLEWNSTCFGQFHCPSSGVFHWTHSNGICHTGLLTACDAPARKLQDTINSQIYSWNEILHVSDSSTVHHQEFFTVHTAMVYVIQVCW